MNRYAAAALAVEVTALEVKVIIADSPPQASHVPWTP